MIRKLLLILLFFTHAAFGQQKKQMVIDSLLKVLPTLKADTTKVKTLNIIAYNYTLLDKPLSGIDYAEKALELAQKIKSKDAEAKSYENLAIAHEYNSDGVKERAYYFKALEAAKASENQSNVAHLYKELAINHATDDIKLSVSFFNTSLSKYRKLNEMKEYYDVLVQMGGTYQHGGLLYQAADCFSESLKYGEKVQDTPRIVNTTIYLADIYAIQSDYNKALSYYDRALKMIDPKKPNKSFEGAMEKKKGDIYSNQKKYPAALASYIKSWNTLKDTDLIDAKLTNLLSISITYIELKNQAKAQEYLQKAKELNETNPYQIGKVHGYFRLGKGTYAVADYDGALEQHTKALNLATQLGLFQETALSNGNVGTTLLELAKKTNADKKALIQKSISHLVTSVTMFRKINYYSRLQEFYGVLSEAYEINGDQRKALNAFKDHITFRDSVFNTEKRNAFLAKQSEYEYSKKEALLKSEQNIALQKEKTRRNISYAGIGFLLALSTGAGYAYSRKRKDNRLIAAEKKRSDDLLLNILPAEVAEELKSKGEAAAQYYDQVSIIFTDFVGFTKLSEKFSPEELIGELNYCFKAFDTIITKHNIEKIKTIGDSYMAVCGLPGKNPNHAKNAVEAALEIRDFIVNYKEERKAQGKTYFEMRIGINSGEVVAGIVGIKKFAYDIWGDAVNIASRIETNGEAGKVNISETTYNLVKDNFKTEYRGEIDAKGKGAVKMYFVEPKQSL